MTEINKLVERWTARFPRRQGAGRAALLGFRYQLIVALRDTVRSFLRSQVTDHTVFVEQISDICEQTIGGQVIFTQVKQTGRSVTEALNELWSIHETAAQDLPDLVPNLRYRILCSKWMLKNIGRAIERWQPTGILNAERLASFKSALSTVLDPNPFDELLAIVAGELAADPAYDTVLSWIGALTNTVDGPAKVWSDL